MGNISAALCYLIGSAAITVAISFHAIEQKRIAMVSHCLNFSNANQSVPLLGLLTDRRMQQPEDFELLMAEVKPDIPGVDKIWNQYCKPLFSSQD